MTLDPSSMLIDIEATIEEFVADADDDATVADCADAVIAMLKKHYGPRARRWLPDHGGSLAPPSKLGDLLLAAAHEQRLADLGGKGRADGSIEEALGIDTDDAKAILAHLRGE
jgi:hypothetical protein